MDIHTMNKNEYKNNYGKDGAEFNKVIVLKENKFGRPIYKCGHTITPIRRSAQKFNDVDDSYLTEVQKEYPNAEVVKL